MTQTSDPQGKAYTDGWRARMTGDHGLPRLSSCWVYALGYMDADRKLRLRAMGVKC